MSAVNGPDLPSPGLFKRLWKRVRHPSGASNVADIAKSALVMAKEAAPGPSKSAIGGVVAVWDAIEHVKGNKERARGVTERMKGLRDKMPMDPVSDGACVGIPQFLNTLEEINQGIDPILSRSWIAGLMHLNRDEKKVGDASRRIDEEVNDVQALLSANIQIQVINTQVQVAKLEKKVDDFMRRLLYMNIVFFGLF